MKLIFAFLSLFACASCQNWQIVKYYSTTGIFKFWVFWSLPQSACTGNLALLMAQPVASCSGVAQPCDTSSGAVIECGAYPVLGDYFNPLFVRKGYSSSGCLEAITDITAYTSDSYSIFYLLSSSFKVLVYGCQSVNRSKDGLFKFVGNKLWVHYYRLF